jgi:ferric-dicitrate binding protein FerR (iron transport regulator)
MKKDFQDIIQKYLNSPKGESPDIEKQYARLFCDRKSVEQLRDSMGIDWETMDGAQTEKALNPLLHRIHFLINSEKTASKGTQKRKGIAIWHWYSRVAALLLLPLMVWALLQREEQPVFPVISKVKVVAPWGSRIHVDLPDGSSAWLNSGSELTYEVPFKERRLAVRGEAFFDVIKDSLRPMVVEGPHTNVKVLGTRFNVKMWPDEEITEVVLARGKVEMTPHGSNQSFVMQPGDMFVYNQAENRLSKEKVIPEYYFAWVEGKLVLRNQNMEQVARDLSRWFNVDIEVVDPSLKDDVFHATFVDEKLEDVLRLLKLTSPIDFEIIDNEQQGNGEFVRKRVIIKRK